MECENEQCRRPTKQLWHSHGYRLCRECFEGARRLLLARHVERKRQTIQRRGY